jgi:RNA polymerase II subunit A C-terminal domain phosphatase SSU72
LPGPSADRPNVYDFGVPYDVMQKDLLAKDSALYERNGVLAMLERNKAVKPAPEKWQTNTQIFDIVVTFETRVFDAVVERMLVARNNPLQ